MLSKLRHFKGISSLWPNNKKGSIFAPGFCSIVFTPNQIDLAYAKNNNDKIELQFIESYPYKKNQFSEVLNAAVKRHQLEGVYCTWVLPPERYQSILLDALPVAESEFQAAVRWKIKGTLQYPEEDIVVDHFPLPMKKTHDPHEMIVVVVAQQSFLQPHANKIQQSGLRLTTIDIQELALRNITALYENDEKTTAFIYLREKSSELVISCQKELYFHRHLELTSAGANLQEEHSSNPELDKAALELQRSFDYFQGQWRKPPPTRVFLAASEVLTPLIMHYFTQYLALPIQPLDLREVLKSKQELSIQEQGHYLPLIGGLLREESEHHAATS